MQSAKRTVPRRCATQYSGSVASASVMNRPLRFETKGIVGAFSAIDRR